jgi:23S rRNA pseudouridine1911/1915/1917 synthase
MVNQLLYEDNHIIIVNKLPGDLIQADKFEGKTLRDDVKVYLKEKYNKPGGVFLGTVHRLDRPVSGAVIFARTSKALTRLNNMLRNHEITKTYWAVVDQPPEMPEATLENYLRKDESKNKSFVVQKETKGAVLAKLSYRMIASSDRYYLLEVELETGRHHQIRAQLAAIGCRIKGDLKYGFPRSNPSGSVHLHARKLEFMHPVKKEPVSVTAPCLDDPVWNFFEAAMQDKDNLT